jgi:hypothetical protein
LQALALGAPLFAFAPFFLSRTECLPRQAAFFRAPSCYCRVRDGASYRRQKPSTSRLDRSRHSLVLK